MSVVTQRYTFSGSGEDFGPRKGAGIIILHTFENSDPFKNTMRDALAGAIWQDRNDVLGSYNRLIAVDGVLGCVPDDRISGGVNPGSIYFKPRPWLYEHLPPHVVRDPNSYALQLCAMGQKAYYDTNGWPPPIIDGYARSIIEEEQRIGHGVVVANHADFQPPPGRYDAGQIAVDLVMKRYEELTRSEDDMPIQTRPVREQWDIPAGMTFWVGGPGFGVSKTFAAAIRLWSNGETADQKWRRLEYVDPDRPDATEELWADGDRRTRKMTPVPGTRNPATGFGNPTLSGVPLDSWHALKHQAVGDLRNIGLRATADADALEAKQP